MNGRPPPVEILPITKGYGGALTTIDRSDPYGASYPVWVARNEPDGKSLTIFYADPRLGAPNGAPLGTARFHTFSSKIDVFFRGTEFKMRNNDMMGLVDKHVFSFLGASEMTWRQSTMSSTIYYEDSHGNRLACFTKQRNGMMGKSRPCFELFVPAASLDLELLVVTGMAVMTRAKHNKKEEEEAAGEVVEAVLG